LGIIYLSSLIKNWKKYAIKFLPLEDVSAITERDDNVSREYNNILRQLITRIMENPRNITWTLDALWTVRSLESIGDHACYICEHLIFMIKGEETRHLS